jgi:superfamily II DNA helicase RecQ
MRHVPLTPDYMGKYSLTEADFITGESQALQPKVQRSNLSVSSPDKRKDSETLVKELKEFRLATSRTENVKPYFIFDNKQMDDLVARHPQTKEELLAVNGFGPKKLEKYGDAILKILNG